jgi:serine/threonine protein kinase
MLPLSLTCDNCPVCGIRLSSEFTAGLCPKCLLASAIEEPGYGHLSEMELAQTLDSGSSANAVQDSLLSQLKGSARGFGDYELLHEIARGGMGVVYKARHQRLGREVALKVILSGQFASPNDVRRFEMEAESAAALDHSGIVPIYEIGEYQGHHFFTMKLIEGGSLAQRMSSLRGDMRRFIEILAKVAEAIDYAHRRGILHRDIKPANILLDSAGHPLITDLGLAKRTEADSDITGTGAVVGTPAYMPPEQASASKEITTFADIYSIGAILYEGLTGRPPHKGDSPLATLMLAAKGDVQPPSEVNRQCDRVLELICMKCLSREPNDRYVSSSVLANVRARRGMRAMHLDAALPDQVIAVQRQARRRPQGQIALQLVLRRRALIRPAPRGK